MRKPSRDRKKRDAIAFWRFFAGIVVYVIFVSAYYLFVLLFLRDWLARIFKDEKTVYVALTLPLIVGQAFLLEMVTLGLRKFFGPKEE